MSILTKQFCICVLLEGTINNMLMLGIFMKLLEFSYKLGGYYDIVLGLGILFLYKTLFPIFSLPIPDELLYVQVTALFLLAVGFYLLFTAKNAENYLFVGVGSIFVRFVFAILVLIRIQEVALGFKILAIADTLIGLLILYPTLKIKLNK